MDGPELLKRRDVEQRLGCHGWTVYELVRRGVLHPIRPFGTRTLMFRRAEIDALIAGEQATA